MHAIGQSVTSHDIAALFEVDIGKGNGGAGQWGVWHLPGTLVLRVTLDHRGRKAEHRYLDKFESPNLLTWQSQPTVTPESKKGQDYVNQRARGINVHLYARGAKYAKGRTLPFVYLGQCDQLGFNGSRPMTLRWRLRNAVPNQHWAVLKVPIAQPAGPPEETQLPEALDDLAAAELASVAASVESGDFHAPDGWTMAKRRAGQRVFREKVLARFSNACCVCGLDDERLLDASHIVPWRDDPDNRLNPANGLALCVLHHRALDAGLLHLSEEGQLRWAGERRPKAEAMRALASLHGSKATGPLTESRTFLRRALQVWPIVFPIQGSPHPSK